MKASIKRFEPARAILFVAALGGIAAADPDLTIKHIPAKLQMRPKHVAQQSAPEPKADAVTAASAKATGEFRLGGHAQQARFGLTACLTCHTFETTCAQCHRGTR